MTADEAIELMLNMNENYKRTDRDMIIGLYIETKDYQFYMDNY